VLRNRFDEARKEIEALKSATKEDKAQFVADVKDALYINPENEQEVYLDQLYGDMVSLEQDLHHQGLKNPRPQYCLMYDERYQGCFRSVQEERAQRVKNYENGYNKTNDIKDYIRVLSQLSMINKLVARADNARSDSYHKQLGTVAHIVQDKTSSFVEGLFRSQLDGKNALAQGNTFPVNLNALLQNFIFKNVQTRPEPKNNNVEQNYFGSFSSQ
jgi:hypothetical protein